MLATIGQLVKLSSLNLASNRLTSLISPSIGTLTKVTYFDLSRNCFQGKGFLLLIIIFFLL